MTLIAALHDAGSAMEAPNRLPQLDDSISSSHRSSSSSTGVASPASAESEPQPFTTPNRIADQNNAFIRAPQSG